MILDLYVLLVCLYVLRGTFETKVPFFSHKYFRLSVIRIAAVRNRMFLSRGHGLLVQLRRHI